MRTVTAFATAFALVATVFACSSADPSSDDGENADQGTEQDISAAKAQLKGSWVIDAASAEYTSAAAYEFRPNGEVWRDSNRVLNGMLVKGAPPPVSRDVGHYTVNGEKHTLTIKFTGDEAGSETLSYAYKAPRILNGLMRPGAQPNLEATLTLTGIAAPGSHVAYPSVQYNLHDSYCTADADCDSERADKTWQPRADESVGGLSQCDTNKRVCSPIAARPEN